MSRLQLSPSMLSWLRCFDAVARTHGFTRAAQELHITQSAVSQQVRQLEGRLGARLFKRSRQGMELTLEGRQLYQPVRDAFLALEDAIGEFDRTGIEDTLELVCAPSFAMRWLMPRMRFFFAGYPKVPVRLQADFHTLVHGRRDAGANVAILGYEPPSPDGTASVVLDEWLFPVASPQFLASHPELRTPADLQSSMLLHDDVAWLGAKPHEEWRCWMASQGIEGFDFQAGPRFNLSMLAIDAALSGRGVAIGRAAIVLEDILAGRLVNVFGQCTRSPAAYLFDSLAPRQDGMLLVQQWLHHEADRFRVVRDRQLGIGAA